MTPEEVNLKLKKPKKKKKLRKREKLDYDALEREAKAAGLEGAEKAEDLEERGSRLEAKREEERKKESQISKAAFEKAKSKAVDKSLALKESADLEKKVRDKLSGKEKKDTGIYGGLGGWKVKKSEVETKAKTEVKKEEKEEAVKEEEEDYLEEDDEELQRTLQRARQAALRKRAETPSVVGVEAVVSKVAEMGKDVKMEEGEEGKAGLVFTDTGEFCRSLQVEESRSFSVFGVQSLGLRIIGDLVESESKPHKIWLHSKYFGSGIKERLKN